MAAHIGRSRGRARRAARLAAALALVGAAPASAQDPVFIDVETSEGTFTVELFDFPDVVDHARFFAKVVAEQARNGVFHRGDKLRFCDDTYCFFCNCTAALVCANDPNQRSCPAQGAAFWIVDDQTQPAPYLQAGRFRLDDLYDLEEVADTMPVELKTTLPTYSNTAFTVAFVRVETPSGPELTSEWIVNLENNPELDDPFGAHPTTFEDAYLVFGRVVLGQNVVAAIAGLKTHDATMDTTLDPLLPLAELEQVPVFEEFDPEPGSGDAFLAPACEPASVEPDDKVCRTPLCVDPRLDLLACETPRCAALIPLTEAEQEIVDAGGQVDRYCASPALSSFPILLPEPGPAGLAAGVVALSGLARRRRHRLRAPAGPA